MIKTLVSDEGHGKRQKPSQNTVALGIKFPGHEFGFRAKNITMDKEGHLI